MRKIKPKVFIACDTTSILEISKIIKETKKSSISFGYKFGLEFLNSKNGRNFLSKFKNEITFGDYKLADIPNTCASAVKSIKDLNFDYITIHISSGIEALKTVKKVSKSKIVGVTILTSLNNKSLKEIGYNKDLKKIVVHQARLANKANLDAIVCSPQEIKTIKKIFKKEIITPGIRLPGDGKGDQKRVMTPKKAFKNGATSLVMGRSLLKGNLRRNIFKLAEELK